MTRDREELPEEQYDDLVDLEVTEHATIRAHSDLLRAEFSTYQHPELQCGVSVVRDGRHISLSAGTVNDSETPHLYAWCGLTPDQARVIADALNQAADAAEESKSRGPEPPEEDTETFLQKLSRSFA